MGELDWTVSLVPPQLFLIVNQKGGVGKSTAAWCLGYSISKSKRVLLVDEDEQRSLSLYPFAKDGVTKLADAARFTLSDMIENEGLALTDVAMKTEFMGLDVVCADGRIEAHGPERIAKALLRIASQAKGMYDYVFIDFRRDFDGVLEYMMQGGLERVKAIVPVRSEESFSEGLAKVVSQIGGRCDFRVLFGQVYRPNDTQLSVCDSVTLDILQSDFPNVKRFKTLVRLTPHVSESSYYGKPVCAWEPEKKVSREFGAVAEEIIAMCEKEAGDVG